MHAPFYVKVGDDQFVACSVDPKFAGSGFMKLDLWQCVFDGLVENCLMCGAPKAPIQEQP